MMVEIAKENATVNTDTNPTNLENIRQTNHSIDSNIEDIIDDIERRQINLHENVHQQSNNNISNCLNKICTSELEGYKKSAHYQFVKQIVLAIIFSVVL